MASWRSFIHTAPAGGGTEHPNCLPSVGNAVALEFFRWRPSSGGFISGIAGVVVVRDSVLTNATDAPTIVVTGFDRPNLVYESRTLVKVMRHGSSSSSSAGVGPAPAGS